MYSIKEIDAKTLDVIKMFMSEIGLEKHPDPNAVNIVDQDTGNALMIGNKYIIYPGCRSDRNSIVFDPVNNWKVLNYIFMYFLHKWSEENDIYVSSYYYLENNSWDKPNAIEIKLDNNGKVNKIKSRMYYKDCLRYLDIIMQLNGEMASSVDLSSYDEPVSSK